MASQITWAQAVCLRYANNSDDSPTQDDLDDVETHWDEAFGDAIAGALSDAGIDDTPTNRAIVQMIAVMSAGTPSRALTSACRFVKNVTDL